jgi:hypothetical protein
VLIILEGPDCARKTTLAHDIVTRLAVIDPTSRIELFHRGPPTRHPLDEYVTPLLDYRPDTGRHIVCDRWHWGEMVYPTVLNRKTKMDAPVFQYIEMFLQSRGAVTTLMCPPLEELEACVVRRGDGLISVNQLPELRHMFIHTRDFSTTGDFVSHRPTPDSVIANAQSAERRAAGLNSFVTPVGHPSPEFIIFGDVRGCSGVDCQHRIAHSTLGPAFMPYNGTSGHYLLSALDTPLGMMFGIMFANACDVDDVRKLNVDRRCKIIALGKNAHRRLDELNIRHAAVPHPQYVRRFHHLAAPLYGQLIRELIGTERDETGWRP